MVVGLGRSVWSRPLRFFFFFFLADCKLKNHESSVCLSYSTKKEVYVCVWENNLRVTFHGDSNNPSSLFSTANLYISLRNWWLSNLKLSATFEILSYTYYSRISDTLHKPQRRLLSDSWLWCSMILNEPMKFKLKTNDV